MDFKHIIVLITVPSEQVGEQIATALLEANLAACVNMVAPIRSLYTWEGVINDDEEMLLIVKSRAEFFESRLVPAVQAVHPYDVPEIIALPILMGSKSYLDWIDESTNA
jgi:periplasmic divalent cation tolerance protein